MQTIGGVETSKQRLKPSAGWPAWRQAFFISVIVLLTAGAAALRWTAACDPLWLDELHTAWVVADRAGEVWRRSTVGNQSPLYFGFVFVAVQIGGLSPIPLRLVSLVCGVLLVPLAGWMVYRFSGQRALALFVTAMAAVDPWLVYYSAESRPYSMVAMAALGQLAILLDRFLPPRRRRIQPCDGFLLTGATTFLLYLHYTAIVWVAAQLVILGVLTWSSHWTQRRGRRSAAANGMALAPNVNTQPPTSTVPLSDSSPSALQHVRRGMAVEPVWKATLYLATSVLLWLPGLIHALAIGVRGADWFSVVSIDQYVAALAYVLLLYVAIPLAFATVTQLIRWSPESALVDWRLAGFTLCVVLLPLLLAIGATACGVLPLALFRFTIASAAAASVLAGLLVSLVQPTTLRAASLLVVSIWLVVIHPYCLHMGDEARRWWPQWTAHGPPLRGARLERWDLAVATLNRHDPEGLRPILLVPNLVEDTRFARSPSVELREYYQFPLRGPYWVPSPERRIIGLPLGDFSLFHEEIIAALVRAERGWLVIRSTSEDAQAMMSVLSAICREPLGQLHFELMICDDPQHEFAGFDGRNPVWVIAINAIQGESRNRDSD